MLSERQQVLTLMTLLYERERAPDLFGLFPREQAVLGSDAAQWLAATPELRKAQILRKLKRRTRAPLRFEAKGVHAEWFADFLKGESPRMSQVMLRLFPAALAKTIESMLGPSQPSQARLRPVHPELMHALGERFIGHWNLGGNLSAVISRSPLAPLLALESAEWISVVKEVARQELTTAFYGLKKSAYTAIFHRLPLDDAKDIAERMVRLESAHTPIDKRAQQKARMHIVSLDSAQLPAAKFILHLGFYLYAKAIWHERDSGLATQAAHAFPVADGKTLMSLVLHHQRLNTERSVAPYQKRFLEAEKALKNR